MLSGWVGTTPVLSCNAGSPLYSEGPYLGKLSFSYTGPTRFVTSTHNLSLQKIFVKYFFFFFFLSRK